MPTAQTASYILPPGSFPAAGFFRLTVAEYHAMIEADILTTDDRVELLDGYLVNKMSQNTPHSGTVDRLIEDVNRLLPSGWRLRSQLPVTLTTSEPEPDLAVARGDRRTFDTHHPRPADLGLLVEVADSSVALDRGPKSQLYAAEAVPVYWVVNIPASRIEVYTDPDPAADPPAYRARADYPAGQAVPLVLDGVAVGTVAVADVLPNGEITAGDETKS